MDLGEEETLDLSDAVGIDNIRELVDSIYNDKGIFSECMPDSPPDSNPDNLLSPGSSTGGTCSMSPPSSHIVQSDDPRHQFLGQRCHQMEEGLPDLSSIDYTLPMQLIEHRVKEEEEQSSIITHPLPSVCLPIRRNSDHMSVQLSDSGAKVTIKNERNPEHTRAKRKRKEAPTIPVLDISSTTIKTEPDPSTTTLPHNIQFHPHIPHVWHSTFSRDLSEQPPFALTVTADKGFNYSALDEAFIAQKKNHFQLTCQVDRAGKDVHFVKVENGGVKEISHLQLNFYGIKLDVPNSHIRVEQSQSDRSKTKFDPIPVDFENKQSAKVSVGRLHFTETTQNNMRKKGKPNPAQKYFQLVVALEAVVSANTSQRKEYPLVQFASERIIVRASNPGQFEPEVDGSTPWLKDFSGNGENIYHIGKVGINTDSPREALSVLGNIQLTGQLLQPSDMRIKEKVRELDTKRQLDNVNQIKIVEYNYKKEFVEQLPKEQRKDFTSIPHTGVIAQEVRSVLPDAVSSAGDFPIGKSKTNIIPDMLIVNKDRLFLENVGAVKELSKMTDSLEHRIGDLEKASESVAVRLSRLRRSGVSLTPSTSSIASSFAEKSKKSRIGCRARQKTLFHNKYIQFLILLLGVVMALSLTSIAIIYGLDYHNGQESESQKFELEIEGANATIFNEIIYEERGGDKRTTRLPPPSITSSIFIEDNLLVDNPPPPPPIIGGSCEVGEYCRSYCCSVGQEGTTPSVNFRQTTNIVDDNNLTSPGGTVEADIANAIVESIHPDVLLVQTFVGKKEEEEEDNEEEDFKVRVESKEDVVSTSERVQILNEVELDELDDFKFEEVKEEEEKNETNKLDLENENEVIYEDDKSVREVRLLNPPYEVKDFKYEKESGETNEAEDEQEDYMKYEEEEEEQQEEEEDDTDVMDVVEPNEIEEKHENATNEDTTDLDPINTEQEDNSGHLFKPLDNLISAEQFENVTISQSSQNESSPVQEDKEFNEVIDKVTSTEKVAISNLVQESHAEARARRDVSDNVRNVVRQLGNMVSGIIRKIRNVDDSDYYISRRSRQSKENTSQHTEVNSYYPVLLTEEGNYTLDSRFCHPNQANYRFCISAFDSQSNISLSLPISRHFPGRSITISFPRNMSNSFSPCPSDLEDRVTTCGGDLAPNRAVPTWIESNLFEFDLGSFKSASFRLRYSLSNVTEGGDLCSMSKSKLGAVFKEYNFHFYRVCHY